MRLLPDCECSTKQTKTSPLKMLRREQPFVVSIHTLWRTCASCGRLLNLRRFRQASLARSKRAMAPTPARTPWTARRPWVTQASKGVRCRVESSVAARTNIMGNLGLPTGEPGTSQSKTAPGKITRPINGVLLTSTKSNPREVPTQTRQRAGLRRESKRHENIPAELVRASSYYWSIRNMKSKKAAALIYGGCPCSPSCPEACAAGNETMAHCLASWHASNFQKPSRMVSNCLQPR